MATHSDLNALATPYVPTRAVPTQWTPINNPTYPTHCRFYLHDLGNFCRFGNSCNYLHAYELYRPTVSEQTMCLLQATHQLILFAVTCLQHSQTIFAAQQSDQNADEDIDDQKHDLVPQRPTQDPSQSKDADAHKDDDEADIERFKMSTMVNDKTIDSKEDDRDEPSAEIETFENHIEIEIDTQDKHKDFRAAKVPFNPLRKADSTRSNMVSSTTPKPSNSTSSSCVKPLSEILQELRDIKAGAYTSSTRTSSFAAPPTRRFPAKMQTQSEAVLRCFSRKSPVIQEEQEYEEVD